MDIFNNDVIVADVVDLVEAVEQNNQVEVLLKHFLLEIKHFNGNKKFHYESYILWSAAASSTPANSSTCICEEDGWSSSSSVRCWI